MKPNKQKELLYVAGAYHSDLPENIAFNIAKAEKVSIELIRNGWDVFTPHKNTAGYERYEDKNINKRTWIDMDLNILARCDGIFVMDNWRTSAGTKEELKFARDNCIPVYFEEVCAPIYFTKIAAMLVYTLRNAG